MLFTLLVVQVPCDAALAPPRVRLASVSPASLGLLLVTGLATGLGVIIVRRIRRDEQEEEEEGEVMCSQSLTQPDRF